MKKVLLVVTIGILFLSMFSVLPTVPSVTAQQPSEETASVRAATQTIPHKGHMIIESIGDPETVDPAWAYDTASCELIRNVYETLIAFDREKTYEFVPALATSWTITEIDEYQADTGLTWKQRLDFTIRDVDPVTGISSTVRFHNGEPLMMEDIEYSFERLLVQDRSGGPSWMMYEPVQGIGLVHAFYYTDDPAIQDLIVNHAFQVSGNHFIMNLAVRYAPILGILAQSWASILDKSFVTALWNEWPGTYPVDWDAYHDPAESPLDTAGNVMCGTGPYSMGFDYGEGKGYWTHGVEWSIVRFPQYWGGWPYAHASDYLDRVTEKVVYEWSTRLADFRAGTADTVYVPRQYMEQVRGWPGIRGLPETPPGSPWGLPSLYADAMFFNFAIDPASPYVGSGTLDGNGIPLNFFSDIHVRKGFAYLFDFERFLSEVWLNEAIQPSSPVLEGLPYHVDVPVYYMDLSKAADEFKQAFGGSISNPGPVWTNGFRFKVTYDTGNQPRQVASEIIRNNALAVNQLFRIETLGVTSSTYLGEIWWYPSFRSIMPIFLIGKPVEYPDPHSMVFPFMHTYGYFSYPSSYSSSTVDALIEEGIATEDGPARATIYAQLQQMYYEDCPSVMLEQPLGRHWERDWVQGWYYNPMYVGSPESGSLSLPPFYHMWEGLNGDVNNDGTVNLLDLALLNQYWWTPPVIGPAGYYEVKYDIGPYLQYQIDLLPPPGDSVGTIDSLDMAIVKANWGAGIQPPDPPGPTMLVAPIVDDPWLVSDGDPTTPEFAIGVTIEDVEAMWGVQFKLAYDTSVLTATSCSPYTPFDFVINSNIDDAQGLVSMGCLMPPPEFTGFYWYGQYPIAWIEFSVDSLGASPLRIKNSLIVDIYGGDIGHTVTSGWFRNVPGVPIADFSWTPWSAQAGQPVAFTSLSFDPEGTIVTLDWDWGDGTPHGTTETETRTWATNGTYTVTLTVTDNDGLTDSQARSIIIEPPPLAGAIVTKAKPTHKILDFTKHGTTKQSLLAWAKNLDETRPTLVKVEFDIWSDIGGYLGTNTTEPMWIAPLAQGQFKVEFDMMDPRWGFVGGGSTVVGYTVYVEVYYADYFIGGDPNYPHWAQVPNPPEVAFTFKCSESAPKPVMAYTYNPATGTVLFDGSQCTDPDMRWGDYIAEYRWQIYENGVGLVGEVYGPNPSFTLPEDGEYRFRLRVQDMFGVKVQTPWTAYVYFDVP